MGEGIPPRSQVPRVTVEEVKALQDIRHHIFVRADELNAIEKYFLNQRWPLVASLLTKLEDQVSQ